MTSVLSALAADYRTRREARRTSWGRFKWRMAKLGERAEACRRMASSR